MPRVLDSTVSNTAKEDKESTTSVLFFTEAKEILRGAKDEYMVNMFNSNRENIFAKVNGTSCDSHLSNIKENINYYVEFNDNGNVIKYYASDGNWIYSYIGENLNVTDIYDQDFVLYKDNFNKYNLTCTSFERNE